MRRGVDHFVPIGLAALFAMYLAMRPSRPCPPGPGPEPPAPPRPPGPPPPGGDPNERPRVITGGSDAGTWTRSRVAAALDALKQIPTLLDPEAVAYSVVAHWAIETAWGAVEVNYNVGNIKARGSEPFVRRGEGKFRAFDSIQEAVVAYAKLLQTRYSDCAALLLASPETSAWYACLGSHGYYSRAGDIDGARAKVVAFMGGS